MAPGEYATLFGGWGAFGVLATFTLYAVIGGRLIPKSTHQSIVGQEKVRGDEWKETALSAREALAASLKTSAAVEEFLNKIPVTTTPIEVMKR